MRDGEAGSSSFSTYHFPSRHPTFLLVHLHVMGAPKKKASVAKHAYVQLRLNAAHKRELRVAAERAGLSMSSWIVERCLREARRESVPQHTEDKP